MLAVAGMFSLVPFLHTQMTQNSWADKMDMLGSPSSEGLLTLGISMSPYCPRYDVVCTILSILNAK